MDATCDDCLFFKPFRWPMEKEPPEWWIFENENRGLCRRYPPKVIVVPLLGEEIDQEGKTSDVDDRFPSVGIEEWCGEHRQKAT